MELAKVIIIIAISAVCSAVLTGIELPILRKLKAGQEIREEGPKAHQKKAGTPTMGGVSMLLTIVILGLIYGIYTGTMKTVAIILVVTLSYAAIGFRDDFLKITRHQNEGLTSSQKMALQILIGTVFAFLRYKILGTELFFPFVDKPLDFGYWIIPFSIFVFVAMTNAVNLTDGLDGLAASVTMNSSFFTGILAMTGITTHIGVTTLGYAGNTASAAMAFILCGACIGFLVFNHHPAKVFMGDTGSLALGAALSAIAMTSGFDFALPIVGLVYVVEAISVIIQVVVFKTQNGRRFFRMAPIHHHFELGGWSEVKVDTIFCVITVIMGIIAIVVFR